MHHHDPPTTFEPTPSLLSAIRRARAFDDAATAELARLSDAAESTGDYRYRDERCADLGEVAREHLCLLLNQLDHIR
jgi:hypothetical protein